MTRSLAYALVALLLPTHLVAGAWPREQGEAFLSLKVGSSDGAETSYAIYSEYGATPRLTLGLSADRYALRTGAVELFSRFALRPESATQISTEFNVGYEFDTRPVTWPVMGDRLSFGAAVMVGRGFSTPVGAAWADLRVGRRTTLDQLRTETEAKLTTGVSPTERVKLFVDIEHDIVDRIEAEPESFTTVAPTVAVELAKGTHATVGYTVDPGGDLPSRIDVGVWLAF
ncbi:hypothetical protein [Palleronia abyssalis]|uniref:DUF481 domain-containing protein n=1 Tax=Palleronia abyssalis TaxID=1501240 RepID=A0A2R8C033_9RHOB|nr:hypothetical protein [Palleronia abyssalis]SPJ25729.1 hypothetical protein PAA8504_03580 [Palleronia abyssalis]